MGDLRECIDGKAGVRKVGPGVRQPGIVPAVAPTQRQDPASSVLGGAPDSARRRPGRRRIEVDRPCRVRVRVQLIGHL